MSDAMNDDRKKCERRAGGRHDMKLRRDADFWAECRAVIDADKTGRMTERRVAEIAAARVAPRYYVSDEYALRITRYMRRYPERVSIVGRAAVQWHEIFTKVERMRTVLGIGDEEALWRVLDGEKASSYFMTPEQAVKVYRKCKKHMRGLRNGDC
jgi:hypothetical protein